MTSRSALALLAFPLAAALAGGARAQAPLTTTPERFFGHPIGADYLLPDYDRMVAYWRRLDQESERMALVEIGKTAEGRAQHMAIVTSPANHRELERYRRISERLARAAGVGEAEAVALAREGKAVVWIDGGLHASEVLGAQQLVETVHQLVSRDDPETLRILDDVIVLAVHANPDGHDLVSRWYLREPVPERRSTADLPVLYQKYVGHDNNRDFYMSTQAETENINRQLYHHWFPQVVYNHHQAGPPGTVMFAPPFRDPYNYLVDPLIVSGLELVGAAMQGRFLAEGKPGVTSRTGANYSAWWNGGLRTTVYFHNMLGLLTETIGNPTPIELPFVVSRQLPSATLPAPVAPQRWHFRASVDYSVTANYAVLDLASRYRDAFLLNAWRMGRNAIERGSRDSWTVYPRRLAAVRDSMGGEVTAPGPVASQRSLALLRRPEWRDPRGYVIPADQPDFATAAHFVNALLETGITVHRANAPFEAAGRRYPAGSYVLQAAQPFRAHLLDMFEPQDHPHDFLYPGGPPIAPYDAAGWTLAYQMGIRFDRVLDGFDGPFEEVREWNVRPAPGSVAAGSPAGYLLSARHNDAVPAALRLAREGEEVYRLSAPARSGGAELPAGSYYVRARRGTRARVERLAADLGVHFPAPDDRPAGEHLRVRTPRIALWDRYGGSAASGWARWILEQRGIPFDVVYPGRLDAGALRRSYDLIVFPSDSLATPGSSRPRGPAPESVPAEHRHRPGEVTAERTIPALRDFLEQGGTVVAIGLSTPLARHLGVPVGDHLVDAQGRRVRREEHYVPGSLLRVRVDPARPVAAGMEEEADLFFDQSPVFSLEPDAESRGVRRIAWFHSERPLRSGWAWGEERLQGGAAAVEAPVGRGRIYLFGPDILYRAQSHGTFKLFLNALTLSAGTPARVP